MSVIKLKNKYLFEKNISMPLCAVKDNLYFNFLDGQVIDNENVISFIKESIKRKSIVVKETDLVIYKVISIDNKKTNIIAYNYLFNGCSNYIDKQKQLISYEERQYVINNIMNGTYKQEIIWGDNNE